jgi:hypothetical protein
MKNTAEVYFHILPYQYSVINTKFELLTHFTTLISRVLFFAKAFKTVEKKE